MTEIKNELKSFKNKKNYGLKNSSNLKPMK